MRVAVGWVGPLGAGLAALHIASAQAHKLLHFVDARGIHLIHLDAQIRFL